MAKMRKPTPAQLRALTYLVEGTPYGVEFWYDAKQVERESTWRACVSAGWVEGGRMYGRVWLTAAGREVIAPTIRGRAEARQIIADIEAEAAARTAAWEAGRG